jgi:tetratricopeptide (TPR) repeat protein
MEWLRICRIGLQVAALVVITGLSGCTSKLEVLRKQGVREYQAGQLDQAQATLKNALHEDQFDAVSNAYAGMIEYRQDNLAQAEYHFRVALQSDPSSEEAKSGLTATLIKQGKPDEALDALERAAKLAEKVPDPRWEKTDIKKPYTKQVEERLYLGKEKDRIRIAQTYETLGDYENALVYYKKALEYAPQDGKVLMAVAQLAEKAGNKPQTVEYLKKAYRAEPGLPGLTDAMTRNGVAISDVIGK